MLVAANEARLNAVDKNGIVVRKHVEAAARRGTPDAVAMLEGPEFPESMRVLWDRFCILHQMRPVSMQGLAPLTAEAIKAANDLFDWHLSPLDVEGLHSLDVATRHPEVMDTPADERRATS